ncbi:MAG: ribonuclease P protein component [Eggerthellaceae bacterium]
MLETIKSSTEISYIFANGKRFTASSIVLLVQKKAQHDQKGRVAFVAGKKLGNAVWRNAAKRRMRAVCRDLGGPWAGYDVVFIARKSITSSEYSKVLSASRKLVTKGMGESGK